jgi:hypothetical protein
MIFKKLWALRLKGEKQNQHSQLVVNNKLLKIIYKSLAKRIVMS